MTALAIALIVVLVVIFTVYGRALVYGLSDEYKMDQRIKQVLRK